MNAPRLTRERMLTLIAERGDELYDPDFGLCRHTAHPEDPAIAKKYSGHFVAWVSPAYAEALLALRRDVPRAARIIERICDFQETDPGWPTHGNYHAVAEWRRVDDQNAVCFLAVALGEIWMRHRALLPAATRKRLFASLDLAALGLLRRRPDVFYTNIYLLTVAGELILARILDRPDLVVVAQQQWDCFIDRLARENISEFNSPSYTAVHLECLLTIGAYAANARMRREAGAVFDRVLTLLCLDYHEPSRTHAGTMSRVYRENLFQHMSSTAVVLNYWFGAVLPSDPADDKTGIHLSGEIWLTRHNFRPRPALRALLFDKPDPLRVRERMVSYWGRDYAPQIIERASTQTGVYSLATLNGVWPHYGHCLPFHFTHAGNERRRSIFFQHEVNYSLVDAWLRQNDRAVLGAFFWGLEDYGTFRAWWSGPPFRAGMVCCLGRRDEMRALRLNGRVWNGKTQPRWGAVLEIEKATVTARLTLLPPPAGVRAPRLELGEERGETILLLRFAESDSADAFWNMPPAVAPILFEVSVRGERERAPLAPQMAVRDGRLIMRAGNLRAEAPLTMAARAAMEARRRPPLRQPLVESPVLTVLPDRRQPVHS